MPNAASSAEKSSFFFFFFFPAFFFVSASLSFLSKIDSGVEGVGRGRGRCGYKLDRDTVPSVLANIKHSESYTIYMYICPLKQLGALNVHTHTQCDIR